MPSALSQSHSFTLGFGLSPSRVQAGVTMLMSASQADVTLCVIKDQSIRLLHYIQQPGVKKALSCVHRRKSISMKQAHNTLFTGTTDLPWNLASAKHKRKITFCRKFHCYIHKHIFDMLLMMVGYSWCYYMYCEHYELVYYAKTGRLKPKKMT